MRWDRASGSISDGTGNGMRSGSLHHSGLARSEERQPVQCGPIDQFHAAVVMLNECRAAFDPVAIVHVHDAVDLAHFGVVDVAADHAVETAAARLGGQSGLETID